MVAMRISSLDSTPPHIFPLRKRSTRDLAEQLAERAQTDVNSAMRFLQTNLRNGGATQAGDKDRYTFTSREASRFMMFVWKGAQFRGQQPRAEKMRQFQIFAEHAAALFHREFFDGVDLSQRNAAQSGLARPIPLVLAGPDAVHDGDTWKGLLRIPGASSPLKSSMRFASYDAPEVSGGKLKSQKARLMKTFRSAARGNEPAVAHALDVHLRYQGALTTLLWKDFVRFAQRRGASFEMAASYVGGQQCADACGKYEMVGNYGRWIGMPQVTDPRLISEYLRTQLPITMATEGVAIKRSFMAELDGRVNYHTLAQDIARRGSKGKAFAQLIDPSQWLDPKTAYRAERASALSARWTALTRTNSRDPERRGYARDLSAMTIHVGLGYHYNKYPSQRSPFYEHLEAGAKQAEAGLWNNALFKEMEWVPRHS